MSKKPVIDLQKACLRAAQLVRERGLAKRTFARYTGPERLAIGEQELACGQQIALAAQGQYAVCALGGLALAIHEQDPRLDHFPDIAAAAWSEVERLACTLSQELPSAEDSNLTDWGDNECLAQLVALNDQAGTTAEMVAQRLERMAAAAPTCC